MITLIMAESGRLYDQGDLGLASTLADRASAAIDNAKLFSELARAHQHTAAERDRLRQLVESAPIEIAILRGPDLVFEVANEPFERTFGGRKLRGLKQSALDPTGKTSVDLRQVMATGERISNRERAVHFDWDQTGVATTRYFDLTLAPMRDTAGTVDGVMSFSLEVTEQVLARMRIEEAHAQAELANRAKDEFLAMLGHELRNPLAPILTALELMELRGADIFERERTVIARQVRHVVRLVDDLLDVSRITRGGVELHLEQLDLADIIGKAIEIASPLLEERGHQLVTHISRKLDVQGDPVRLAQVIANLVTNAAKYTERGGTITVTAALEDRRVAVHVRDTGVGIPPEVLPLVFETFYQARQSIDRARGGLGLGLAIVRSLVELHGGEVRATSDGAGKGSEFSVWLPALDGAPTARRATGKVPRGNLQVRTEKILVVDDNVDALNLLSEVLEQRGFSTFRAHDAPSALALAAQALPQIALLDIGLPVMDGYELGRRLREIPGLEQIRLVAVTGYGQPSDLERSEAARFAAHLVKPISIERLHATIEELAGLPLS
ncbi:MAG: response regulator [Deltaproteobacteria bacterium]|nr:response regulator [Deltaproteobacteria bacterium]